MTKGEVIEQIAQRRIVETMVAKIAHSALTDDLKDLCQMVYLIMMEYDDDKIVGMYDKGQMPFFIARIILNQYHSTSSPFYKLFRRSLTNSVDISTWDQPDEK